MNKRAPASWTQAILALGVLAASCSSTKAHPATAPTTAVSTTAVPTTAATPADPLAGRGAVEVVGQGYGFLEGPQWVPDTGSLLFTQTFDPPDPAPKLPGAILQLGGDGSISVYRDTDTTNGLALDPHGRLIAAEPLTRRVTITERDGTISTLAERFEEKRLNEPNDIAVRSDGTVYFTDPVFGHGPTELSFHGIFRVAPSGDLTAERRGDGTEQPNGLALSPDEKRLYIDDTIAKTISVFDVASDGSLANGHVIAHTMGYADGIAIDKAGNLYVASIGFGIEVFAADGSLWGLIPLPNPGMDGHQPTNCAFGGTDARTLYITANGVLYRVRLHEPGIY